MAVRSLHERVKAHNDRIHERGFSVVMTITNAIGQTQEIKGSYIDTSFRVDPETQLVIRARRTECHFHMSRLEIGTVDEISEEWTVEFTNNSGERIRGVMQEPAPDYTLDMFSFVVKTKRVVT